MLQPTNIEFFAVAGEPDKINIRLKLDNSDIPASLTIKRGIAILGLQSFREQEARVMEGLLDVQRPQVLAAVEALASVLCSGVEYATAALPPLDDGMWAPQDTGEIPA